MIGKEVSYLNEYDELKTGLAVNIGSDKFDDVKWLSSENENGTACGVCYWSKKKKSYELVKEKDIESIYLEVKGREYSDFIYLREVINLPYLDNFK